MNPPSQLRTPNQFSFEILNNAYIKQADEPPHQLRRQNQFSVKILNNAYI